MVGETVGSYRIERELGTGGMGAVYLARHALLDKLAAVKMLRPKFSADAEAIDRFFTEAKATTAVRHPGIVDVYDFGFHESGSAFLVMELLDGETLGDAIRDGGALGSGLVAAIGWQVAGALAAAHERDIIHRDLKPDNVFLLDDPTAAFGVRAKVLDFGIAKLVRPGSVEHTSPGEVVGTPLYMSPEQCRGQTLTGASDVYSLACVLHHALAGSPPYASDDTVELLKAHALAPVPRLAAVAPSVVPELAEVIAKCLSKDAGARPDGGALSDRLRQIAEQIDKVPASASVAGPAPTVEESDDEPPAQSRPAWLWPAVGAVALAAVVAVALLARGSSEPQTPVSTPEPRAPTGAPAAAVDAAPAVVVETPDPVDAAVPLDAAGSEAVARDTGERPRPKKPRRKKKKKKKKKKWGELLPRSSP